MIHELKIWSSNYEELRLGAKRFEVRRDRAPGFKAGDLLELSEYEPEGDDFTGRVLYVQVTSLLRLDETPEPWGLRAAGDVVVMGVRVLKEEHQ